MRRRNRRITSVAEYERLVAPVGLVEFRRTSPLSEAVAAGDLSLDLLDIDAEVARRWGGLNTAARRAGRSLPTVDGLLLATAATHGLALVTRNVRDCAGREVEVVDPWADAG